MEKMEHFQCKGTLHIKFELWKNKKIQKILLLKTMNFMTISSQTIPWQMDFVMENMW